MRIFKWFAIVFIVLVLLVVLFKGTILQGFANFLIADEDIEKSDVIIVLGGEKKGERTDRAIELLNDGVANKLLFSDGTDISWRIRAIDEMVAYAKKNGVLDEAIFLEDESRSTYENALYSRKFLESKNWDSAVVVTTDWHTKRSKYIFDKVFEGSGIKLHYAKCDDRTIDSLEKWWKDSEKQQIVLSEWARLVVYWIKY